MKTNHTPGPWKVIQWSHLIMVDTPHNGFDTQPRFIIWNDPVNVAVENGDKEQYRSVQLANAKLMAAAPELLEALMESRKYLPTRGSFEPYNKLLEKINTAIKKATE